MKGFLGIDLIKLHDPPKLFESYENAFNFLQNSELPFQRSYKEKNQYKLSPIR